MSQNTACPYCGQHHRSTARFCPATGKVLKELVAERPVVRPTAGKTGLLSKQTILKNRYPILQKIGQGGMAAVYQVSDNTQPGVVWAVKEMSAAAITNPDELAYAVAAFQQEANLLRSLDHPNLPKVVDSFTEEGKHFLVMEFVPENPSRPGFHPKKRLYRREKLSIGRCSCVTC